MKLFLDASAVVAMLGEEDGYEALAERAETHDMLLISAMAMWETVSGLCRSHRFAAEAARSQLQALIDENDVTVVPIGERESEFALDAYVRFGKGNDPAGLNMGDCFAYACAKANAAKLLYKGQDFDRTDLAWPNA